MQTRQHGRSQGKRQALLSMPDAGVSRAISFISKLPVELRSPGAPAIPGFLFISDLLARENPTTESISLAWTARTTHFPARVLALLTD